MREFLKVSGAAAAVMAVYFGYTFLRGSSEAYLPQFQQTKLLMRVLEEYRDARGSYPVLRTGDSTGELNKVLANSGVSFRSPIDLSGPNGVIRYVSVDGKSYGLLLRLNRAGEPPECILEVGTHKTGWWGQPPACPL